MYYTNFHITPEEVVRYAQIPIWDPVCIDYGSGGIDCTIEPLTLKVHLQIAQGGEL